MENSSYFYRNCITFGVHHLLCVKEHCSFDYTQLCCLVWQDRHWSHGINMVCFVCPLNLQLSFTRSMYRRFYSLWMGLMQSEARCKHQESDTRGTQSSRHQHFYRILLESFCFIVCLWREGSSEQSGGDGISNCRSDTIGLKSQTDHFQIESRF